MEKNSLKRERNINWRKIRSPESGEEVQVQKILNIPRYNEERNTSLGKIPSLKGEEKIQAREKC